jgi:hypothetical protein
MSVANLFFTASIIVLCTFVVSSVTVNANDDLEDYVSDHSSSCVYDGNGATSSSATLTRRQEEQKHFESMFRKFRMSLQAPHPIIDFDLYDIITKVMPHIKSANELRRCFRDRKSIDVAEAAQIPAFCHELQIERSIVDYVQARHIDDVEDGNDILDWLGKKGDDKNNHY